MSKVIQLCACLDTVYALTEDGCIYRSEDDCDWWPIVLPHGVSFVMQNTPISIGADLKKMEMRWFWTSGEKTVGPFDSRSHAKRDYESMTPRLRAKAIKERERRAVEGMATLIRCELATKLEDLSKLNANQFIDYFLQLWESEREKENAK